MPTLMPTLSRLAECYRTWRQSGQRGNTTHIHAMKVVPGTAWTAGITDQGELILLHLPTLTETRVDIRGNILLLQRLGAVPMEEV